LITQNNNNFLAQQKLKSKELMISSLQETLKKVERDRQELIDKQEIDVERYVQKLEAIEEQLREKDAAIIKLKQQFEDREASLQNDLSEYTKALVAAHRSLEDKTCVHLLKTNK